MNSNDIKLENMIQNYDFKNAPSDLSSIYFLIKMLGNNINGAMINVWKGEELVKLVDNCENIDLIYAIDDHKPYVQEIFNPRELVDIKISETCKFFANHYINYSNNKNKIQLKENNPLHCLDEINDSSLDFVIVTRPSNIEEIEKIYIEYYKKIKKGGYLIGVNYDVYDIENVINTLIENSYFKNNVYSYGHTWLTKKD